MEDFHDTIKRVNACIARTNRDKKAKDGEEAVLMKPLKVLNLILDVPTRWNSTYFMLERAFELRKVRPSSSLAQNEMTELENQAIDAMCSDSGPRIYQKYKLEEEEWSVIRTLIEILKVRLCYLFECPVVYDAPH